MDVEHFELTAIRTNATADFSIQTLLHAVVWQTCETDVWPWEQEVCQTYF